VHGQETIEFNELAAATLDWRCVEPRVLRAEIRQVFGTLDSSSSGQITFSDLRRAFPCCSSQEERALAQAFDSLVGGTGSVRPEDLEHFVCEALGAVQEKDRHVPPKSGAFHSLPPTSRSV